MANTADLSTFGKFPVEIVCQIFEQMDRTTLLQCAQLNSHYYSITKHFILKSYKYDSNQDFDGTFFHEFLEDLKEEDSDRRTYLRTLSLRNDWYDKVKPFEYTNTLSFEADTLGQWILQNVHGLKHLHVAYKRGLSFLSTTKSAIQSLTVRPAGIPAYTWSRKSYKELELKGTLDARFLPTVLRSEYLKTLNIGAEIIEHEKCLLQDNIPTGTSAIEHLRIKVGNFDDHAIIKLLQAPSGLKTFEFTPINRSDIAYDHHSDLESPWDHPMEIEDLPAISSLANGLANHTHTLTDLTIYRANFFWFHKMDRLGSLAAFRELKNIDICASMLLGWNHCQHIRKSWGSSSSNNNTAVAPSTLPDLLPRSLETLRLRLDHGHSLRNGSKYILEMLRAPMAAHADKPLPNLRAVRVMSMFPYCEQCEADGNDDFMVSNVLNHLSIQEAGAIYNLVQDAPFKFVSDWDGTYWDEDDPAVLLHENLFTPDEACSWSRTSRQLLL